MANTGPAKIVITAEDIKKFQAILKLPTPAAKAQAQKELSADDNVKFVKYVAVLKHKQEIKKLDQVDAALAVRQQEAEAKLAAEQARARALQVQMQEAEAGIRALEIQQADLQRQDKAILTQAAARYAEKLDTFTRENPAVNTSSTTGAPKLNQKK